MPIMHQGHNLQQNSRSQPLNPNSNKDFAKKSKQHSNSDSSFFTTVEGATMAIGSYADPASKAGLLSMSVKLYKYGTQNYPDIVKLYAEIENLGARLLLSSGRDLMSVGMQAPKDKSANLKDLIYEIINEVRFEEEDFKKAQRAQLMEINELKSQDLDYTLANLGNLILKDNFQLGTEETLKNIAVEDIKRIHQKISDQVNYFRIRHGSDWESNLGADKYRDGNQSLSGENNLDDLQVSDRVKFLKTQIPQKVFALGLRMKPISQYDYFSASVAGRVLSNGLVGLVPQIIREENSAAYYAYSRMSMYKFGGVLYVAAGVSQENLTKCLKLSIDILNRVVEKDFSDDHLKMAQEKSKAMLDQYMDNPKALFELYSSLTLRGLEILSYDEWIDKIQSVTKAQVAQFVESILNGSQFYLAVNGNLEDKVMNNCKELIK